MPRTTVPQNVDYAVLCSRIQCGDHAAYDELLLKMDPYLRTLIQRAISAQNKPDTALPHNSVDTDDLYQLACLQLYQLAKNYAPGKYVSASDAQFTYYIGQRIAMYLKRVIMLERSANEHLDSMTIRGAYYQFIQTGKNPSAFIHERDFDEVCATMATEAIDKVLGTLTPREERVLRLRYGLCEGGNFHTLEETAKYFNVTSSRIRQIEAKALRKLRMPQRAVHLELYRP